MPPVRRAGRTLPGTSRPLLAPGLAATATHLAARLRAMRAAPGIRVLAYQGLVHHRRVWLDAKHEFADLDLAGHVAGQVHHIELHRRLLLPHRPRAAGPTSP